MRCAMWLRYSRSSSTSLASASVKMPILMACANAIFSFLLVGARARRRDGAPEPLRLTASLLARHPSELETVPAPGAVLWRPPRACPPDLSHPEHHPPLASNPAPP